MDGKRLALLIGALILAGVSAFMARSMLMGSAAPMASAAQQPTGPEVLVAIRALPVGTIVGPEMLRYQPWPKDLVENVYYLREGGVDPASLNGAVVRSEVTAGQPLTIGSLVKPGDRGFLAAALGPGMRAVTVPVSAQSGVGGLVFPGDRIDLVLTQDVKGGGDGPSLKTSETIIRNMRVLATDQRTDNKVGEDGKTVVVVFSTVTLEATPKIAEKVAVAQTIGTLSLSLRSIADNTAELERAIAAGEVTVPQNGDPKAEKQMLLQVASRPIDTDTTFTVGADVSRFQRRTVPAKQTSEAPVAPQLQASAQGLVAQPTGPVIRVARGNVVTDVPVGGK